MQAISIKSVFPEHGESINLAPLTLLGLRETTAFLSPALLEAAENVEKK
jgi:hypothetical protein